MSPHLRKGGSSQMCMARTWIRKDMTMLLGMSSRLSRVSHQHEANNKGPGSGLGGVGVRFLNYGIQGFKVL